MVPTIEKIEKQKRGSGVDLVVDGSTWITVHRDVVFECAVRRGDPATEALRSRLESTDANHRAYASALLLLSYRPRAEGELRQRLRRKGLPEAAIDDALVRLRRTGLVDDEQFSRAWVENRGSGASARGMSLLAAELRAKGIDSETITEALAGTDESELALAAARPRAARLAGLEYGDFRRRLAGFLQRRGFGYDATAAAVRQLWRELGQENDRDDGYRAI
jgi:regulatory protein